MTTAPPSNDQPSNDSGAVDQLFKELTRGHVSLHVEAELRKKLESGKRLTVKSGYDPTAPDLHLGHTVVLNCMRRFQEAGHRVVFLIGDFTGQIGDPSGKSKTRKALTKDDVLANAETYKTQVFKVLDPDATEVRFNSEWFDSMSAVGMVELASRYNLGRMLEREDFKTRYRSGESIALHEFLYPLVQAYDSVALEADVELGGSDQLFNLMVGRDLMKSHGMVPQVVMTMPLLEGIGANADESGAIVGDKMSKSLDNYVGITDPPDLMFGKVMSISDPLMWRWYELLSEKTSDEIIPLKSRPREAKELLGKEIVRRFHNQAAADGAAEAFRRRFRDKQLPDEIPELTLTTEGPMWVPRIAVAADLAKSTSEARRLIKQGAVRIDGERIADTNTELAPGASYLLQIGRRRIARINLQQGI